MRKAVPFALAAALALPAAASEPYEVRTLELHVNDLVWHGASGRLLASAAGEFGPLASRIVEIDPESGAIGDSAVLAGQPVRLALSDDGSRLYAGLDSAGDVQPVALPGLVPGDAFPLPEDPQYGLQFAGDLDVMPGAPDVVAVALHRNIWFPRSGGVMVFDAGVARPNRVTEFVDDMAFSGEPGALYGYHGQSSSNEFWEMKVDAGGVAVVDETEGAVVGAGARLRFLAGRLYSSFGRVLEPGRPSHYGSYWLSDPTSDVAVDAGAGLVYFLEEEGIGIYDLARFVRIAEVRIAGLSREQGSLVLWRKGGLAFRSGGRVYLVDATLPDEDGDGHGDPRDNCFLSANAGQQDGDGDRVGAACDPDDTAPDVPLAVCEDEVQENVARLYACLYTKGFEDGDADDEHDAGDHCPGTPAHAAVDDSGCSLEQFCTEQGGACEAADWRNDEPKGKPRDCERVGSKRTGYTCQAAARRRGDA